MWVCSLRVKRGTGRAFSLTLAYCFIQTSEVEEQLNKRLHARADQARILAKSVNFVSKFKAKHAMEEQSQCLEESENCFESKVAEGFRFVDLSF